MWPRLLIGLVPSFLWKGYSTKKKSLLTFMPDMTEILSSNDHKWRFFFFSLNLYNTSVMGSLKVGKQAQNEHDGNPYDQTQLMNHFWCEIV